MNILVNISAVYSVCYQNCEIYKMTPMITDMIRVKIFNLNREVILKKNLKIRMPTRITVIILKLEQLSFTMQ